MVKDREAWRAAVHSVTELGTTQQLNNNNMCADERYESRITKEGVWKGRHTTSRCQGWNTLSEVVQRYLKVKDTKERNASNNTMPTK